LWLFWYLCIILVFSVALFFAENGAFAERFSVLNIVVVLFVVLFDRLVGFIDSVSLYFSGMTYDYQTCLP